MAKWISFVDCAPVNLDLVSHFNFEETSDGFRIIFKLTSESILWNFSEKNIDGFNLLEKDELIGHFKNWIDIFARGHCEYIDLNKNVYELYESRRRKIFFDRARKELLEFKEKVDLSFKEFLKFERGFADKVSYCGGQQTDPRGFSKEPFLCLNLKSKTNDPIDIEYVRSFFWHVLIPNAGDSLELYPITSLGVPTITHQFHVNLK